MRQQREAKEAQELAEFEALERELANVATPRNPAAFPAAATRASQNSEALAAAAAHAANAKRAQARAEAGMCPSTWHPTSGYGPPPTSLDRRCFQSLSPPMSDQPQMCTGYSMIKTVKGASFTTDV